MSSQREKIAICGNHPEYPTPVISTMAFPGAEFWCPHCGGQYGVWGNYNMVPLTDELQARHDAFKEAAQSYITAHGRAVAAGCIWNGTYYDRDDYPAELLEEIKARLDEGWEYKQVIEEVVA